MANVAPGVSFAAIVAQQMAVVAQTSGAVLACSLLATMLYAMPWAGMAAAPLQPLSVAPNVGSVVLLGAAVTAATLSLVLSVSTHQSALALSEAAVSNEVLRFRSR
jgi:hypothetical protein